MVATYSARVPSTNERSSASGEPGRGAGRQDRALPDGDGPPHGRRRRSRRVAWWVAITLCAVTAFVAVGAAAQYLEWRSRVDVSDVSAYVPEMAPSPRATGTTAADAEPADPDDPYAGQALDILVMGTDYRDAENEAIAGREAGMRSDTTLLVHVSGDRSWIEVVSIPRDSLVDVPACTLPDGSTTRPRNDTMFNAAFEIGSDGATNLDTAAACTISTVYALTGVPITNHVVVKMTGVIGVVDALDGVRMCLPEPVRGNPRYSPLLDLPAGPTTLDGRTAIEFLRARKGTGLGLEIGSDLTRITRQQAFLQATVQSVTEKNLLTDYPALSRTVGEVLGSLAVDPELAEPARLAALAFSINDVDRSHVVFTELPVAEARSDRDRVVWTAGADAIWERFVADAPPPGLDGIEGSDGTEGSAGTTTQGGAAVASPEAGTPGVEGTDATTGADPADGVDVAAGEATDGAGATTDPADGVVEPFGQELLPGVCPPA